MRILDEKSLQETLELIVAASTFQVKMEHPREFNPQVILAMKEPAGKLLVTTRESLPEGLAAQCADLRKLGQKYGRELGLDAIAAAFLVSEAWLKDNVTGERIGESLTTVGMRPGHESTVSALQVVTRTKDGRIVLGEPLYCGWTNSPLVREFLRGMEEGTS